MMQNRLIERRADDKDEDDVCQLSAETMHALTEFYADVSNVDSTTVKEDWQLSQFWYSEATALKLAEECITSVAKHGRIACISCPTLLDYLLKDDHVACGHIVVTLFEYDRRFETKFSKEFVPYDYRKPLEIPELYHNTFDLIVADPPFLSDECFIKVAQTIRLLSNGATTKLLICTGLIMAELKKKLRTEKIGKKGQSDKRDIPKGSRNISKMTFQEDCKGAIVTIRPQLFGSKKLPINLACGHTICRNCLKELHSSSCPLDQAVISLPFEKLPPNLALLSVLSEFIDNGLGTYQELPEEYRHIESTLVKLASYLHPAECLFGGSVWSDELSRPMQRKLISLLCYQLMEYKGLQRALRTARALAERALSELIIYHQDNSNISANLWSAIRSRGCQFLGPAMQEEVLKLVLLILSEGALMSRKTLVLYIVETLREDYPQVSKTCVGHVVQLLYRASCFNVLKREGESSLMQLKTQFRDYDSLRREHDAQIVQVAFEQGLRISPDQWSALLYGDQHHRSHMQSIIDKLQSTQDFEQQISDLKAAIERSSEREMLASTFEHFERFANFNYLRELPNWTLAVDLFDSLLFIVKTYVKFMRTRSISKFVSTTRYIRPNVCRQKDRKCKTRLCRDMMADRVCPAGLQCSYALMKNGFHASLTQTQAQPLRFLTEPNPSKFSEVQLTGPSPLLTSASSAFGNDGLIEAEEESVNLPQNLVLPTQPSAPSFPLVPLMISSANNPLSLPLVPLAAVMQVAAAVPRSSVPPISTGTSFPVLTLPLQMKYDPSIQSGYSSISNNLNGGHLILQRRLDYLQCTESTVADENLDEDDLQSHVSYTVAKSVLYEDKEGSSANSLELPSVSLRISPLAAQPLINNPIKKARIPTACPFLSVMNSSNPSAVQLPLTAVNIRDTIKQSSSALTIQNSLCEILLKP
uniref:RING-type E3 ubiquitin transferase n=1 Tax=Setaria digitata TaxID=48799 RepID=A0A915PJW6_9BILA